MNISFARNVLAFILQNLIVDYIVKKQIITVLMVAALMAGCSSAPQQRMCVPDFCNIWGQ